jgi:broad specificity phosphatase PhoE
MTLFCLRHGESDYNLLGLCNDDPRTDVHLTDTGRCQAEQAAEQLQHAPIECIFVSELPRTRETAEIINTCHNVDIITVPALNDIVTGFDNQPVADYFAATGHDRLHMRINGGESLLDYKTRVYAFIDSLAQQPVENVCIVSHEETMRIFGCYFCGISDVEMENLHFRNCEVFEFEL